ncbi:MULTISPECIES: potassium-transporting ATPase subunit KdpC [Cryobacterium]|uniref:Potassium-transporting ATPase KdpC subunit n=1 Tax=Cryobacterium breve TaxID=1259258 RepID=A0ABY2IZN0_9MICO|nr:MULTISPECIES: potassium-transporting ATPase subunit KdpC [Cryobacterium]TFC96829.1 potassium-transporting ATPase subunit KdpC [Cryobacterium sp. TmT3-12]TFC97375.1 potassium-transporting ATPase subunit KdpC [Cryobacterium breve]
MTKPHTAARQYLVALRALIVFTAVLGVLYPLAITLIGQTVFPGQANGSLVSSPTGNVGSTLIGQAFTDGNGTPLPRWFQGRPSAAGDGYDAGASGGSNLGPENPDLLTAIEQRKSSIAAFNGVLPAAIPADALTTSASGLDPHISAANALLQAVRVADARGLPAADVSALVESKIQGRDLGFLGEPTVNVLELNLALAGKEG